MGTTHRARWAAFGAAVAVSMGAAGFGLVSAAVSSGERTVYVAIQPCRLFDTRTNPEFHIGSKPAAFGHGETASFATRGSNGQCSGIPADATAVQLNVTSLNATLPTFLAIWPTGGEMPNASSLNPMPGQPPTPNAVTTDVNADGSFDVYNLQGSVDVIADVVGYYVDHNHDDRYYTKPEIDARFNLQKQLSLDVAGMHLADADYQSAVGNSGIRLPNNPVGSLPSFSTAFTVPADYTADTTIKVVFTWHALEASCGFTFRWNSLTLARPGIVPIQAGSFPALAGAVMAPATVKQTSSSTFEIRPVAGTGIRPGDSILAGFFRRSDDPADTCTLPVIITGAKVLYD